MDGMTTTLEPPVPTTTAAAAPRSTPEQISPAFFRGAFALLLVGMVLCLGVFSAVAYNRSVAERGTAPVTSTD